MVVWAAAAGLTIFVAWPALWGDPAGTAIGVLSKALGYAVEAEKSTSFFLGRAVDDPGPAFYPVLFVLRASPVMLAGLAAAAITARRHPRRAVLGALVAYALAFGAFMTMGEKKFDRYLLPVFPPLDLVAGAGLVALAGYARRRPTGPYLSSVWPAAVPLVVGAGVLVQGALAAQSFPYFLSFYNPLLGGAPAAARVTLVGWGEGLDQAAAYLNAQPGADGLRAIGWGATMGPLFAGPTLRTNDANRATADYIVAYISDVQTGKLQAEGLDRLQPEHVVSIAGIDYARIYRNPARVARPVVGGLAGGVELLGWAAGDAGVPAAPAAPEEPRLALRAPARLRLDLYWQASRPLDASYTVFTHLVDAAGAMAGQHDGLPAGGDLPTTKWRPGQAVADSHILDVAGIAPGDYWLEVGLYRAETGERLGDRLRLGPLHLEEMP